MIERQRGWPQRPCGQAVSEPSGYPRMAGPDGDCGLGSCSMEALVMIRLQDGQEEPGWADSGVPDAPCPLLGVGATQSSRSALLKGCSSITVGLNLWFGGQVQETCWPSAFLHQWFSTRDDSASRIWHGQETFFWSSRLEREVCYRHLVLGRQERCSKVHRHTASPHTSGLRLFPRTTVVWLRNPALRPGK